MLVFFGSALMRAQPESVEFKEAENPFDRAAWDVLRLSDPKTANIPAAATQHEREFLRSFQVSNKQATRSQLQAVPLQFHNIGPSNVGGRTRAFAIDYTNSDLILAGGVSGGLWRSIDAGHTWVRVSDLSDIHHVSCIAQDKIDPKVWYAGTGEILSTTERRTTSLLRTILTGSGVYRSDDNGLHWTRISPELRDEANKLVSDFQGVWRIVTTNEGQRSRVYVACYSSLYLYENQSFKRLTTYSVSRSFCTEFASTPSASIRLYACGSTDAGKKTADFGVWRLKDDFTRTNLTPTDFPASIRRLVIALAPSDSSVVYLFGQQPISQPDQYTSFDSRHFLWRGKISSSGITWRNCSEWLDSARINTLGGYAMCLAVYPTNADRVFIAGTDVYRTQSGFMDVNDIVHMGGYPYVVEDGRLHPDIHLLSFGRPVEGTSALYACGDGGIAYTTNPLTNGEASWSSLNNGYNVTQCYSVTQDHFDTSDRLVAASLQDNSNYIKRKPVANDPWVFCGGGDGTCCQIMPQASMIFASSQYSSMYAFNLVNSPDEKMNYFYFNGPKKLQQLDLAFVSVFRLLQRRSAKDTVLVLAAANHLFMFPEPWLAYENVSDISGKWLDLNANESVVSPSSTISCMSVSRTMDATLIIGTSDSKVYVVDCSESKATFKLLPALGVAGFVASVDEDEDGRIICCLSNYNTPSVFVLNPGETQWRDISDELEMNSKDIGWGPSVRCVRFFRDPVDDREFILAGTSVGLFCRQVFASTFSPWQYSASSTIGSVIVESIDVRDADGRVVIGTHGAGVYESVRSEDTNSIDTSKTSFFELEQNYPNPVSSYTFVHYNIPGDSHVRLRLFESTGKELMTLIDEQQNMGHHVLRLEKSTFDALANGVYYYKLEAGDYSASRILSLVR